MNKVFKIFLILILVGLNAFLVFQILPKTQQPANEPAVQEEQEDIQETTSEQPEERKTGKLFALIANQIKNTVPDPSQIDENGHLIPKHDHMWMNGVCDICNVKCEHAQHDLNGICLQCGIQWHHKYQFGYCSCGKELVFYENRLPEEYYQPCEHQGNLINLEMSGMLDDVTFGTKWTQIYLPYGYDPEQKYDVMFLQGGLGNTYSACLGQRRAQSGMNFGMVDIIDNMIDRGDCAPFIAVGVDGYSATEEDPRKLDGYDQTARFVREVIYPFIIQNYSTYAESPMEYDIQAARSHFGYGGFSNGGYMAYWGGMRAMIDICGSFLPMAGSIRPAQVADNLMALKDTYRVDVIYAGDGVDDVAAYDRSLEEYNILVNGVDYLVDGENCWFGTVEGGHDWMAGSILLYNGMQVLFPATR